MTLDFWFDPACPFCWMTSRWVQRVAPHRDLEVHWRPISLLFKNGIDDQPDHPYYRNAARTRDLLRVAEAVRADGHADRIGELYTEYGRFIHHRGELDFDVADVLDRLDHVVAPMGAWWQGGDTLDQDRAELDDLLATYVSAQHQLLITTAEPLERSGGSYTLVTGAAGEHQFPGGGLLVVVVRAQYALADVLRHELADGPIRFNELRIMTRVERDARSGVVPSAVAGQAFVDLMTSSTRSELVRFPA